MKMAEAIDFVNVVKPRRAFAIHDAQINEYGLGSVNGWLGQERTFRFDYSHHGDDRHSGRLVLREGRLVSFTGPANANALHLRQ